MAKNNQYLVERVPTGYKVSKCDEDFNLLETYTVIDQKSHRYCDCPNTMASICRHMKMVDIFNKKRAVGKGMFYCYDTGEWTKVKEFK